MWKYLLLMLVSATIGSCCFHLRNSASSPGATSLSQCCPFLVQMPFRSRLMWTLNGANNPIESNTEETIDKIFLWVISASTSLFLPQHTWRLSLITVHCSPSTENPSVLGSISTCFVLLIDCKSPGIASVTASLLLIHFFSSNPCREKRGCSWLKTSIASSRFLMIWWNRPFRSCFVLPFLQLDTLQLDTLLQLVFQSLSLESIVCTSWRTFSYKYMTLVFVYMNRFICSWTPYEPQATSILFGNLHL